MKMSTDDKLIIEQYDVALQAFELEQQLSTLDLVLAHAVGPGLAIILFTIWHFVGIIRDRRASQERV